VRHLRSDARKRTLPWRRHRARLCARTYHTNARYILQARAARQPELAPIRAVIHRGYTVLAVATDHFSKVCAIAAVIATVHGVHWAGSAALTRVERVRARFTFAVLLGGMVPLHAYFFSA
jgi:hypothetical protein